MNASGWPVSAAISKSTSLIPTRNALATSFDEAVVLDANAPQLPSYPSTPTLKGAKDLLHPTWSPSNDTDSSCSVFGSPFNSSNLGSADRSAPRPSTPSNASSDDLSSSLHRTPTTPATTIGDEERRFKSLPPSPGPQSSELEEREGGADERETPRECWTAAADLSTAVSRLAPVRVSVEEVEARASGLEGMLSRMRAETDDRYPARFHPTPSRIDESLEYALGSVSEETEPWWNPLVLLESDADKNGEEVGQTAPPTKTSGGDVVVLLGDEPTPSVSEVSVAVRSSARFIAPEALFLSDRTKSYREEGRRRPRHEKHLGDVRTRSEFGRWGTPSSLHRPTTV